MTLSRPTDTVDDGRRRQRGRHRRPRRPVARPALRRFRGLIAPVSLSAVAIAATPAAAGHHHLAAAAVVPGSAASASVTTVTAAVDFPVGAHSSALPLDAGLPSPSSERGGDRSDSVSRSSRSSRLLRGPAATGPDAAAALATNATSGPAPVESAPVEQAPVEPAPPPPPAWVRPDEGPLSSGFGYRWGALHAGIDLAGPYGSPILAVGDGVITSAGPAAGYGNLVTIEHADGTVTAYGHMSKILMRSGPVHAGDEIAVEGSEGHSTGPHLHFEVRIGGKAVDPIPWLSAHGVGV